MRGKKEKKGRGKEKRRKRGNNRGSNGKKSPCASFSSAESSFFPQSEIRNLAVKQTISFSGKTLSMSK